MPAKPPAGRNRPTFTDQEALQFHSVGRPGKLEVIATKPMATQRDLSLAYSPGVAVPVLAIAEDPSRAYDYTVKGNFVAVITNGTAILGLGNRGALAAKPVMEGKAVLFKRFRAVRRGLRFFSGARKAAPDAAGFLANPSLQGFKRGHAAHGAFRQRVLDRRQAKHIVRAEPHPKRIDELADIDMRSVRAQMASDRLTLGQGLDPGGCQRGRLDAETGIDHDKALKIGL